MSGKKVEDKILYYMIVFILVTPVIIVNLFIKILQFIFTLIFSSIGIRTKPTKSVKEIFLGEDEKECLDNIDSSNGLDFEYIVADLLKYDGFINIEVTKASGDYGADVIAEKDNIKYAIQCKRFNSAIGPKPIGEVLRGMNRYECQSGIVITNSFFTSQAKNEAVINKVELWDREKIIELIKKKIGNQEEITEEIKEENKYRKFIGNNVNALSVLCTAVIIGVIILVAGINIASEFNYQVNGEGKYMSEYIEYIEPNIEKITKGTNCKFYNSDSYNSGGTATLNFEIGNEKNIKEEAKLIAERIYNECDGLVFKKYGISGSKEGRIFINFGTTKKIKNGVKYYYEYEEKYTISFYTRSIEKKETFENAMIFEEVKKSD